MTTMTPQEATWRRARDELYKALAQEVGEGEQCVLNTDAIRRTRECFVSKDNEFVPKPYALPSPQDDAVGLVCAGLPPAFARVCRELGEALVGVLPRESATGHATGYVNDEATMHMTLFHTSHPDQLIPRARHDLPRTIATLREMAAALPPLPLVPRRIVLCATGAVILLYEIGPDADAFVVDRLRAGAAERFAPSFPARQTRAILHTTLARVLTPDVAPETIRRLRRRCEKLTEELEARVPEPVIVRELWFVDESHHYWAHGDRTVLPLLG